MTRFKIKTKEKAKDKVEKKTCTKCKKDFPPDRYRIMKRSDSKTLKPLTICKSCEAVGSKIRKERMKLRNKELKIKYESLVAQKPLLESTNMKTEVKKITPEMAQELLQLNKSNRRLKEDVINVYAREMRRGEWKATGEAIKVSKNKRLLDGQHRLHAIVKAGIPVEMLVITGLEDEVFNVLDTGSTRTAADVLSIEKVSNPVLIAAVGRFIINYNNNIFSSQENNKKTRPLNRDIQKFVYDNPEIMEIANSFSKDLRKFKLLPAATIVGMYYILSKIHINDADAFFNKLITGLDLTDNCPIRVFRERLIRDQINKTRLRLGEKITLMIYSWNNFRRGKSVKILKLDTLSPSPKAI